MWRLGCIGILWLFLIFPRPLLAVQTDRLGAYPAGAIASSQPYFRYYLDQGQARRDSIVVSNRSGSPVVALVYPVDATPNGDGGFGMQPRTAKPRDAGSWIKLEATSLKIPPHQDVTVGFDFQVPPRASVGPHYAGIVVEPIEPLGSTSGNFSIRVVTRLGVRLYEKVPGVEKPQLKILSVSRHVSANRIFASIRVKNDGNTNLSPHGTFMVRGLFGPKRQSPFNAGKLLQPGDEAEIKADTGVRSKGLLRPYRAAVDLAYGSNPSRHASAPFKFWAGQFGWWLPVVVVLISAVFLILSRRKRTTEP